MNNGTLTPDTKAIRALARDAAEHAPAKWIAGAERDDGTAQVYSPNDGPMRRVTPLAETSGPLARYIAAVSPKVVLTLLDRLDQAERERDAAREANRGCLAASAKDAWRAETAERERDQARFALDDLRFAFEQASKERDEARAALARAVAACRENASRSRACEEVVNEADGVVEWTMQRPDGSRT